MNKTLARLGLAAVLGISSIGLLPAIAFADVTNGSFELGTDPGSYLTLTAPDTSDIPNWSVDSGSVDSIGTYWPAADGSRSIDLNGLAPGSISQTITTVPGTTYNVSFYLSGNPDSRSIGDPLYSPSLKDVAVSATGAATQHFTFDTSVKGNSLSNMMWEHHTYSFIATGSSATLTFASAIPGAFGPTIDNVAVSEASPVVSTVVVHQADLDTNGPNPATVRADGQNKWFMYNDSNDTVDNTLGSFVTGPSTPAYGTGSVEFTLAANPLDRKNIATYQFAGTPLSSITSMSYGAYSRSGVAGPNESPYLNFNVDFTGSNTWQRRLVYVPSANMGSVPQDQWNTFDVINGGNALWTWSGYAGNGNQWPDGNTSEYRTWNSIIAAFPNAQILSTDSWLGVRVGEPGPTGYTGDVDFFKIGTASAVTTYDFDPAPLSCDQQLSSQTLVSDISSSFSGTDGSGPNAALVTMTDITNNYWTAINDIVGASWIWSSPTVTDPTVDNTETFSKTFTITGTPLDSTLKVAADNYYSVSVNGHDISGTNGTATDQNFAHAATYPVPAADLVTGTNTLTVVGKNEGVPGSDAHGNPAGVLFSLTANQNACVPAPQPGAVHIFKFVDNQQATSEGVGGVSFPMITPTYGNAPFTLGPGGWTTGDAPYEASTNTVAAGTGYTAYENTSGSLVGTTCDGTHQYALAGYTTGSSLSAAEAATPSTDQPSVTVNGDQYVIVWNKTCQVTPPIKVHIAKYLDGAPATAQSANNYIFPMSATWQTANLNGGVSTSGTYTLGTGWGGATGYFADTAPMAVPADYVTSEITADIDASSNVVASANLCSPGKYYLNGYRVSDSFVNAATSTLETTPHQFTGLTQDEYVIVDNSTCPTTGEIDGMKYNDLNRNGKKDAGEPGLAGWTIRLMKTDGTVLATTVTAADGTYSFPNLVPGTYVLREVHQKGWKRQSKNPKPIVIVAGAKVLDVNFGNALKRNWEREDSDKDDQHNDQQGNYHSGHGISDYDKDGKNQGHREDD